MSYSYNLLDWRDYLRLLYCFLFRWVDLPYCKERRDQIIVIIQALSLVIAINLIAGVTLQWSGVQFDWWKMIFGIGLGVGCGSSFVVFGNIIKDIAFTTMLSLSSGIAFGIMCGVGFGVGFGFIFGVVGGLLCIGVTRWGAGHIGISGGSMALVAAMTGGLASAVVVSLDNWLGVLLGSAVIVVGYAIFFALNGSDNPRSILNISTRLVWKDWGIEIIFLVLASVGIGYLFALLSRWFPLDAPPPLITATIIILVYTRLFLWPLEMVWGLIISRLGMRTSKLNHLLATFSLAYFDRHIILPLPGEMRLLQQIASLDHDRAITEAIELARYSAHKITSVATLNGFVRTNPLGVFAQILDSIRGTTENFTQEKEQLLRYVSYKLPTAPARAWVAQEHIVALSSRLVATARPRNVAAESEVSSSPTRKLLSPPASEPIAEHEIEEDLLSEAIDKLQEAARDLDLAHQLDPNLRHVEAFSALYRVLADALEAEEISGVAVYRSPALPTNVPELAPWQLQEVLVGLDRVAEKARDYATATAPLNRRDALLRATEQLETVSQSVDTVPQPYGPLLKLVVSHWRGVLAAAGGELTRIQQSGPVENPYVIGNPARGQLFVGREDILRRLRELWGQSAVSGPSVVLYGHRRMGKTSILQSLAEGAPFGERTIVVDFNMQRLGAVRTTAELLLALARRLHAAAASRWGTALAAPARAAFLEDNPYTAFGEFLERLDAARDGYRFIVTVDEFEIIERRIELALLDRDLLDYWRGTFQTYPWFIMAFAGLHTLQEMREDYWNPLFASVTAIPVSFLSPGSVRRLITAPAPDFAIDYDADAIDCIYKLTNGQPYLVQLIGHALVTRFNQHVFEAGVESERRFHVRDVEAVIGAPAFYQDGDAYFSGVWSQAAESEPPGQIQVLRALSHAPLPARQIAVATGLDIKQVYLALATLCRHDVLAPRGDSYGYTVELMRRWVARMHPPQGDR